jgi:hypothetical protein
MDFKTTSVLALLRLSLWSHELGHLIYIVPSLANYADFYNQPKTQIILNLPMLNSDKNRRQVNFYTVTHQGQGKEDMAPVPTINHLSHPLVMSQNINSNIQTRAFNNV